uniref:hypothetical protein n=1 Tax=Agathobaculum desmolans TaxID=39484 RepID=UPI0005540BE2
IRECRTGEHRERAGEREHQCENLFLMACKRRIFGDRWVMTAYLHGKCNFLRKVFCAGEAGAAPRFSAKAPGRKVEISDVELCRMDKMQQYRNHTKRCRPAKHLRQGILRGKPARRTHGGICNVCMGKFQSGSTGMQAKSWIDLKAVQNFVRIPCSEKEGIKTVLLYGMMI